MKLFRNTAAILMAFLMLFSTSAFAVSMHYCGKTLVDYSFLQEAKSCGMEKMTSKKNLPATCNIQKKSCCTDKKIVKNQTEVKETSKLQIHQQVFVAALFYTYTQLFKEELVLPISPQNYYPPPLVCDIQLLDEVFLI
jgi:hypothetical protein